MSLLAWRDIGTLGSAFGRFVVANDVELVVIALDNRITTKKIIELQSTDGGETWQRYDTGRVAANALFDAIVDLDGIIHVVYWDTTAPTIISEIQRTAYGTWSDPATIVDPPSVPTEICLARSSAGEIAMVWRDGSGLGEGGKRIYGRKWTSGGGWDATNTNFGAVEGGWPITTIDCSIVRIAYAPDGTAVVGVQRRVSGVLYLQLWAWGATANYYSVSTIGTLALLIGDTGSTVHWLSWRGTPRLIYWDGVSIAGTNLLATLVSVVARVDGAQVLYYVENNGDGGSGLVKRATIVDGVVGEFADYVSREDYPTTSEGFYTFWPMFAPYDCPNTEELLISQGWINDTLTEIMRITYTPITITTTQLNAVFVWPFKFQLTHKKV